MNMKPVNKKLKRMLAVMLAILLALPNTAVGRLIGAGTVEAYADGAKTVDLASVESEYYLKDATTTVTFDPKTDFYVYASTDSTAPENVTDGGEVDGNTWKTSTELSVGGEDGDAVTVYYWQTKVTDNGGMKYDGGEIESGSTTFHIDLTAPTITGISVTGTKAHDAYSEINEDTANTFSRVVDSSAGTVQIQVTTDDDDATISYTGTDISNDGTVSEIGAHNSINIKATDPAGNESETSTISVGLYIQETATVTVADSGSIAYTGSAVDTGKFTTTGPTVNTNNTTYAYSYDGSEKDETLNPTAVGTYYVRAEKAAELDVYALPVTSSWTQFKIVKVAATIGTAPTASEGSDYTGEAKALFATAGEASNGTLYYGVNTENIANTATYTKIAPTKTDAGTYYLFYYAKGNANYSDSEKTATSDASVTISRVDVDDTASKLEADYDSDTGEVTLTATVAKPEALTHGAMPNGDVTFQMKTDNVDFANIANDGSETVILDNGVATANLTLERGHVYAFKANYANGTNYNNKELTLAKSIDLKAPTLSTKTAEATGTTAGKITVNADEASTAYYVVSDEAQDALTTGAAIEEASAATDTYVAKGSEELTASADKEITLSDLTIDTTYYVYLVAKDASGNYSEVFSGSFTTTAETSGASVNIAETNLKYGQEIEATITDTGEHFAAAESITYIWTAEGIDDPIRTQTVTNHSLTDTLSLSNKAWYDKKITVTAKISSYTAITDTTDSKVAAAEITAAFTDSSSATKEYDNTIDVTDASDLELALSGKVNESDDVTVADGVTYAYNSADIGNDKTVTASSISLAGDDANVYSLTANTATLANQKITKVLLTANDVVMDDNYALSKKTSDDAFTAGGNISISNSKKVNSDTVGLTSALTSAEVTLDGAYDLTTPGTYTGTVVYTLNGNEAGHYTFKDGDSEVNTISISGINCTVTGAVTLTASGVKSALEGYEITRPYDGTADGDEITIDQTVSGKDYRITLTYEYSSPNAGQQNLSFTAVSAKDTNGAPYEVTNGDGICSALNTITGEITKRPLGSSDIFVDGVSGLSGLSFSTIYDGEALGTSDTTSVITIGSSVLEDDTVTASVTAISYNEGSNTKDVYDGTGRATITLGGADAANYGFGAELSETYTASDVPMSISPRTLTFSGITTSRDFADNVTATIAADVLDKVSNVATSDNKNNLGLTLVYEDTTSHERTETIITDGTYAVYVTAVEDTNYAAPATPAGTVTVNAKSNGDAAIAVTNEGIGKDANNYDYGETLTATFSAGTSELKKKYLKYKWYTTDAPGSALQDGEGTFYVGTSSGTFTYEITDPSLIGKTIKCSAKLDGYTAVESGDVTITARTLTMTGLADGASVTKTYDGTAAISNEGLAGLTIEFTGALDGEDVSIKGTAGTFASANAGADQDITISTFDTDGENKGNYRIATTPASLTGTGIGTISPVSIDITSIVKSEDYYLSKKSSESTYAVAAGTVGFSENPGMNSESVTLNPTLTTSDIILGDGEDHGTAGTYTDATVKYTLQVSSADTTNYVFAGTTNNYTTLSNVKCVVIGQASDITADAVTGAIDTLKNTDETVLDKTYDRTNKGSVNVNVGEYVVEVGFTYAQPGPGDNLNLTAASVTAAKGDVQYELTNESDIKTAFGEKNYKGKINKVLLTEDDLVVGNDGALSTLAYSKTYDGTILGVANHNGAVSLKQDKVVTGETVTASDTAINLTDSSAAVGSGNGTATITLGGSNVGNYSFAGGATTLTANVSWEITKIEANDAAMAETVYTTTAGTNEQTITFTDKVSADINTATSNNPTFETVTVTGDGAGFIEATPTVSVESSAYNLKYTLTSDGAALTGVNKTAVFTIPVTDGTNYEQNVVITLTLCPRTQATIVVTDVGTSASVVYGNAITQTITVDGTETAVSDNLTVAIFDSDGAAVTATYPSVGSYKMVATYDDGTKYGVSAEKSFSITAGTLAGDSFTVSPTTATIGGTEPTVALANTALSLGEGITHTVTYVATGESAPGVAFDALTEAGDYDVYVSTSGTGNFAQAANLKLAQTVTVSNPVTPPSPGPGPSPSVVNVTGVTVAPKTVEMDLADKKTVQLTATVAPSDATDKTLTWTASPADAVSFSSATANPVTVTALNSGTVTITATTTDGSKTDTATITIAEKPKAATPSFTPAPGTYNDKQNVTITTAAEGASIYYTVDGTEPTTGSTVYTAPIAVESTMTIKAIAFKEGMDNSEVATGSYEITNKVSAPTFSPAAGTYAEKQSVTISSATEGAVIHYTTDDSAPTENSPVYSAPISVEKTMTIKAIAVKEGMDSSDVATARYVIDEKAVPVETVVVSPAAVSLLKGESAKLTAAISPEDATDKTVTWTSGNTAVATVTAGGVVKGIAAGTAVITAEAGGKTGNATVTVTEDAAKEKVIDETDEETKTEIAEDLNGGRISDLISKTDSDDTVVVIDDSGNVKETKVWVGGIESEYRYTGAVIKPEPHVYDGTTRLTAGTDYTVGYQKNKTAGTATVTVKFKGNYKNDPQKINFTITPAVIGEDVIVTAAAQEAGKSVKPKLTYVMKETGASVAASKFTVNPSGKITIADGESRDVTVSAKDTTNFTGSAAVTVEAAAKAKLINNAKITINPNKYTYTGEEIIPEDKAYTVKEGSTVLTLGTDYEISGIFNNVEPGKATVVIEGAGDYRGSRTANFTISKGMDLSADEADIYVNGEKDAVVAYAKGGVTPAVTVYADGRKLTPGTDFSVKYSGNKAATTGATAVAKVTFKGKYKGTKDAKFTIEKQELENLSIVAEDKIKSNKAKFYEKPVLTITDLNGKQLAKSDYTVGTDYVYDEESGIVTVSLAGKGNYADTPSTLSYRVIDNSQNVKSAKAAKIADQTYTGSAITLEDSDLTGKLTLGGKTLVPGTDFDIDEESYRNNVKKGTASFVVRGTGDCGGVKTLKFKIVQKKINWNGSYMDGKFVK